MYLQKAHQESAAGLPEPWPRSGIIEKAAYLKHRDSDADDRSVALFRKQMPPRRQNIPALGQEVLGDATKGLGSVM